MGAAVVVFLRRFLQRMRRYRFVIAALVVFALGALILSGLTPDKSSGCESYSWTFCMRPVNESTRDGAGLGTGASVNTICRDRTGEKILVL